MLPFVQEILVYCDKCMAELNAGYQVRETCSLHTSALSRFICSSEGEGGGGYSKKLYTGRFLPEVHSLTLLYTIFDREGSPFVYLLLTNGTHLSHTVFRTLHPFQPQ